MATAVFGLGCFWGAERKFWKMPGVYSTAVGYAAGITPNPHYKEVCTGMTGHNEVVRVVYDPAIVSYDELLKVFWEAHDPTQEMRQGNDVGTQYRSGIYVYTRDKRGRCEGVGTLSVTPGRKLRQDNNRNFEAPEFYFAEDYHQQYLAKNPNGYCGHGGTGVFCPIGPASTLDASAGGAESVAHRIGKREDVGGAIWRLAQ